MVCNDIGHADLCDTDAPNKLKKPVLQATTLQMNNRVMTQWL